MDLKLAGKRAFVTGSSSGIGEAVARMLAQEGAAVVVHGRNRERAEKVASEINAAGIALGDLSTDEGAAAVYAQVRDALKGNIEILVNNAGGSSTGNTSKPPLSIRVPDFLSNYNSNFLSSVRLVLHAVPDMVTAKFGRVINVSSAVAVSAEQHGLRLLGREERAQQLHREPRRLFEGCRRHGQYRYPGHHHGRRSDQDGTFEIQRSEHVVRGDGATIVR